ncbi:spore germination protein [Paenibacillus sp. MWE-103]|uniref:Spore germination protein n=1 Tax=Paenibacillus artemisiicola TaxID=1172618 RepID=A0ABS3WCR5_9BACL|nr:spore germination protein [Paenibacillus artemisiicola]MBO7746088.1 spore germination protein [Paenibacillus artemisiicola]
MTERRNPQAPEKEAVPRITSEWLRERLGRCGDVQIRQVIRHGNDAEETLHYTAAYSPGMVDFAYMQSLFGRDGSLDLDVKVNPLVQPVSPEEDGKQIFDLLFGGQIILLHEESGTVYSISSPGQPTRAIEESTLELSVKGQRDGFVEDISVNLSLVRRRFRSPKMTAEWFTIGTDSQSRVCLLAVDGITAPEMLDEARRRLDRINIQALHGAGELEIAIADRSLAIVPTIEYVGRPDYVVQSLMNGRFAILVDGTPVALIAPANISFLVKSPEDAYSPYYFASFERLLRLISMLLAALLPGFWLALLAFNNDQVPFTLLATVTVSRFGLPLSPQMELFVMMLMFEIFREAGIRLPAPSARP